MKTLILTTTLLLSHNLVASAQDNSGRVVALTPSSNVGIARQMLGRYLATGDSERGKDQLAEMQLEGESAISMTLDSILEVIDSKNPGVQERIDWALKFLKRLALRTQIDRDVLSPRGRDEIGFKLSRLLRQYHQTHLKLQKITETYDYLKLWGRAELWFLAPRASNIDGLLKYYPVLISIVPELSEEEMVFLEKHIRNIPAKQLLPNVALYQMGRSTERDLSRLFAIYAQRFAEAFQSYALESRYRTTMPSPSGYRDFEDVSMMNFYNEILKHLKLGLDTDPAVRTAFAQAQMALERSRARDGHQQFRQLFFKLLPSDVENIFRTETIQELAKDSLQNGEYVLPRIPEPRIAPQIPPPPSFVNNVISLDAVRRSKSCSFSHVANPRSK